MPAPQQQFFDFFAEAKAPSAKTSWSQKLDDSFDYYADDAEALVYMITEGGKYAKSAFFVMTRADAISFCSHPKTAGMGRGGHWAFAFTTYRRDWREWQDEFAEDDGRFEDIFKTLGINVIYKKEKTK